MGDDQAEQRSQPLRRMAAGAVAGATAKTVVAPLDRVKILFQGRNRSFDRHRGSLRGTLHAVHRIATTDGVRGLWRGHSAMLLRIAPYSGLNYMCFAQYKRWLGAVVGPSRQQRPGRDGLTHAERFAAGAAAGATSVSATYPLDLARARMAYQVKTRRYGSLLDVLRTERLYRGYLATLAGILPYAGTSFFVYDTLKGAVLRGASPALTRRSADGTESVLRNPVQLAVGSLAGAAAQTVSYPIDTVRRQVQLQGLASRSADGLSSLAVLRGILRAEGVRGLFIGLSINYLKVAPATSVSFFVYERLRRHLGVPSA